MHAMPRPRRLAGPLLAALLTGCAPSLSNLVRDKHYEEAICAAKASSQARPTVAAALLPDLEPALHGHLVSQRELAAFFGKVPGALASGAKGRLALVRLRTSSNRVPLTRVSWRFVWRAPGTGQEEVVKLYWPYAEEHQLGRIFGERVPDPKQCSYRTRTGDELVRLFLGLISLGIIRIPVHGSFQCRGGSSPEELARRAPQVAALWRSIGQGQRRSERPGEVLDWFLLLPLGADPARAPLELEVGLCAGEHDSSACQLCWKKAIALPPGATVEERFQRLFGARMQRLADLPGSLQPD